MKKFPYLGYGVCKDYLPTGESVVSLDTGEIVFVPSIFLAEEGDIEIIYKRNGVLRGKLKRLSKISPERIIPKCPVPSACGGCSYQALTYRAQKKIKEHFVEVALKDVLEKNTTVHPLLAMEHPYDYRNKASMPISWDHFHKKAIGGFYRKGTHEVIECLSCNIEDPLIREVLKEAIRLVNELKIPPYDEKTGKGILRHFVARSSFAFRKVMLILVTTKASFPHKQELIEGLKKSCPFLCSMYLNVNDKNTNVIMGEKFSLLFGEKNLKDTLCGVTFSISPNSFYQTNPVMTEKLYEHALQSAGITENDTVLDAYSGIGTIGIIAAKKAKEVYAIEEVEEAVKDAEKNAKENGITNYFPCCGDCTKVIPSLIKKHPIDILFMDPPRKGSTPEFLNTVLHSMPKKVVYISCNPITLARDIMVLKKGYELTDVIPVDLFPMTTHVETIATLSLKK